MSRTSRGERSGRGEPTPGRAGARSRRSCDHQQVVRRAEQELGFTLRPEQVEAAIAVLDGRDALVVMPTGAGKSAIYQVAGSGIEGCTVVVSPLIALQQSQVSGLGGALGGAVTLNSLEGAAARRASIQRLADGSLEFVLVSPELLANDEVRDALMAARPSLLVVDEAHCISTWGHDFRPDYLALGGFAEQLGRPPVLALTASAAKPVRREIAARLGLVEPVVLVTGFDRPEIHLTVRHVVDRAAAEEVAVAAAGELPGRGLVYVARRADAERLARRLDEEGVPAAAYHAGLRRAQRDEVLRRFSEDADLSVVATNAFGMGIDVPDVRFVVHVEPPESLDALYQEIGRAGRDGRAAHAICCTVTGRASRRRSGQGSGVGNGPADRDEPDDRDDGASEVVAALRAGVSDVAGLAARLGTTRRRLLPLLADLEAAGLLDWSGGGVRPTATGDLTRLADVRRVRANLARTRAQMLRRFLDARECRWRQLLAYFGETSPARCGRCDVCDDDATADERAGETARPGRPDGPRPAGPGQQATDPAGAPFAVGTRVDHDAFGRGEVVDASEHDLTVLFDEGGYRVIDARLAAEGLLRASPG